MLYERAALSRAPDALLAQVPVGQTHLEQREGFKDPYILDFLGLEGSFLRERPGSRACGPHGEVPARTRDGLLLRRTAEAHHHRWRGFLHRPGLLAPHPEMQVLIDLKIGALSPADIAQMQLYLNWVRTHDLAEGENDPIGLILCGSRNEQVVELLLGGRVDR